MDEKALVELRRKLDVDDAASESVAGRKHRPTPSEVAGLKQEDIRQLNEINGDELVTVCSNEEGDKDEERDEVGDMEALEKRSVVSRGSAKTSLSQRSYVKRLERQLEDERKAREKLERELEEIKSHLKSTL